MTKSKKPMSASALAKLDDSAIELSDIPELDEAFWKRAKIVTPKPAKKMITTRFDADIIEWFKGSGKGYQTRMNAVLRSYMEATKKSSS